MAITNDFHDWTDAEKARVADEIRQNGTAWANNEGANIGLSPSQIQEAITYATGTPADGPATVPHANMSTPYQDWGPRETTNATTDIWRNQADPHQILTNAAAQGLDPYQAVELVNRHLGTKYTPQDVATAAGAWGIKMPGVGQGGTLLADDPSRWQYGKKQLAMYDITGGDYGGADAPALAAFAKKYNLDAKGLSSLVNEKMNAGGWNWFGGAQLTPEMVNSYTKRNNAPLAPSSTPEAASTAPLSNAPAPAVNQTPPLAQPEAEPVTSFEDWLAGNPAMEKKTTEDGRTYYQEKGTPNTTLDDTYASQLRQSYNNLLVDSPYGTNLVGVTPGYTNASGINTPYVPVDINGQQFIRIGRSADDLMKDRTVGPMLQQLGFDPAMIHKDPKYGYVMNPQDFDTTVSKAYTNTQTDSSGFDGLKYAGMLASVAGGFGGLNSLFPGMMDGYQGLFSSLGQNAAGQGGGWGDILSRFGLGDFAGGDAPWGVNPRGTEGTFSDDFTLTNSGSGIGGVGTAGTGLQIPATLGGTGGGLGLGATGIGGAATTALLTPELLASIGAEAGIPGLTASQVLQAATAAGLTGAAGVAGTSGNAITNAINKLIPGGVSKLLGLGGTETGAGGTGSGGGGGGGGLSGPLTLALLAGLLENPDRTTTQNVTYPSWYTDAQKKMLGMADSIAADPSSLVAPLSANERMASNAASTSAGNWSPFVQKAGSYLDASAAPLSAVDINHYMNPYIESTLAPVERKFGQEQARRQSTLDAQAGMKGAFGGSRYSLENSLLRESGDAELNRLRSNAYSSAYDNATGLASADKTRQANAGSGYAGLGTAVSNLTGADISRLSSTGAAEREAENQRRQAPLTALAALRASLPTNVDRTQTTVGPAGSKIGQAAGALGAITALDKSATGPGSWIA
jgi:hypothetical protein